MSVRTASKAGTWYSANPESLAREIDGYLNMAGAVSGEIPVAALVPHAGLAFSGPTAARVYAQIAATCPSVSCFVVFGAVHTMRLDRPAVWARGAWETPLGEIAVDEELAARLIDSGAAVADDRPHIGDNAIELQTPFLKHCFPQAKIVPVASPPASTSLETGVKLAEIIEDATNPVVVLGSTDLTHYGTGYGFSPSGEGHAAHEWSKQNDRRLLDRVTAMDAESVLPIAAQDRSACGAGAVAATVAYARARGCSQGILLEHTTSYEVMPDGQPSHFVGYGAVLFPAQADAG